MNDADPLVWRGCDDRTGFNRLSISGIAPRFPYAGKAERSSIHKTKEERLAAAAGTLPFIEPACRDQASAPSKRLPKHRSACQTLGSRIGRRSRGSLALCPCRDKTPTHLRQLHTPRSRARRRAYHGNILTGSQIVAGAPFDGFGDGQPRRQRFERFPLEDVPVTHADNDNRFAPRGNSETHPSLSLTPRSGSGHLDPLFSTRSCNLHSAPIAKSARARSVFAPEAPPKAVARCSPPVALKAANA